MSKRTESRAPKVQEYNFFFYAYKVIISLAAVGRTRSFPDRFRLSDTISFPDVCPWGTGGQTADQQINI